MVTLQHKEHGDGIDSSYPLIPLQVLCGIGRKSSSTDGAIQLNLTRVIIVHSSFLHTGAYGKGGEG